MQCSWGKFQGTEHFARDREIEGSRDRESPLYLIINKGITNESIELGKKTLHTEAERKLLGIMIGKDLNFQSHARLKWTYQSRTVNDWF